MNIISIPENKHIFIYCLIILFFILLFNLISEIKLNSIIGFIVSIIVIYFINTKINLEKQNNTETLESKFNSLKIKPKKMYPEIIEFLFNNQDLGNYNMQEYKNLIDNLDDFFELYEQTQEDKKQQEQQLQDKKKEIINIFHSLIYQIDDTNKLDTNINILNSILNKYTDKNKKIEDNIDYYNIKTPLDYYYIYA